MVVGTGERRMSENCEQVLPWEAYLVARQERGSLIRVAREGRLLRHNEGSYVRVGLHLVDESVLALVDLALARRSNLTLVYPSPAGEVSVLLAAQILVSRFVENSASQSVGIVTADGTTVARTWNRLMFSGSGGRVGISEVFPCVRTGPNGEFPRTRKSFKGLLVGRRFADWPVDVVIVDHLAGPVQGSPNVPTINVLADPLDRTLPEICGRGEPIWGWGAYDIWMLCRFQSQSDGQYSPFSVATARLSTIASGIRPTIHVAHNEEAEHWSKALKDDLFTIGEMAGPNPSQQLKRGLSVAWNYQRTLQTLPVRPSQFDKFAGVPPIAARSTETYAPELQAWARSLGGEIGELAEIISGDLADLRNALEVSPPFIEDLSLLASDPEESLVIVRNATAARALVDALGGDVRRGTVGQCQVVSMRTLHRTGTWRRAFVVGMPPRWDWHRLDSGIAGNLHLLVLGNMEASSSRRSLATLQEARGQWSSLHTRKATWSRLVRAELPPEPDGSATTTLEPEVVSARQFVPEPDPFEEFENLLVPAPLFSEEGPSENLAEEGEDGQWQAEVVAVKVTTDSGLIYLPSERAVDVRTGNRLEAVRADQLDPGMFLIVNRSGGRTGLLNAVAERLRTYRPDLYTANLVIRDLRTSIRASFRRSGMSYMEFFDQLVNLGFEKTYQAARGYLQDDGPIAPRDFSDLKRLNTSLELGYDDRMVGEVFTAVQRERTFRRATGRALAEAARKTTVVSHDDAVDVETGLSLADLKELVMEAEVLQIEHCITPVRLSDTGVLFRE